MEYSSTAKNGNNNGEEVQQTCDVPTDSHSNDEDLEQLSTANTSSTSHEHTHAPPRSAEATDQASVSDQHDDTQLQKKITT